MRAVDTDTDAFNLVIAAQRMASDTPEEKATRTAAIEAGYQAASKVPLGTAKLCVEAVRIAAEIAELGNAASVSDAGVAALIGCAGVEGAVYNVRINLPSVKDKQFCQEMERDLDAIVSEARALRDRTDSYVLGKIKKG